MLFKVRPYRVEFIDADGGALGVGGLGFLARRAGSVDHPSWRSLLQL